jgi:peptidoglycan/LPS O-acetylase OafA/YrhL
MVMVFHFGQRWGGARVLVLGQTGVDLFFVLSGFLITGILLEAPRGSWEEIRRFYVRRTLRIFPLYYGYLVLASLAGGVSAWFWVYLQNWPLALGTAVAGPHHFWSLAVEEQFYLVWPFLVLFWPRRWLAGAMWGLIGLTVVSRAILLGYDISPFYPTVARMDGLAAGGLLAMGYRSGWIQRRGTMFGGMAAGFGVLLAGQWIGYHGAGADWVQVTKSSLAVGFYVAAVGALLVTRGSPLHRVLSLRGVRRIGRVSYGMYVFHPALFGVVPLWLGSMPMLVKEAISFAVVFGVSWLSWYGFESQFLRWKERLAGRRELAARAVPEMEVDRRAAA